LDKWREILVCTFDVGLGGKDSNIGGGKKGRIPWKNPLWAEKKFALLISPMPNPLPHPTVDHPCRKLKTPLRKPFSTPKPI
jgi:hypothetical protein